MGAGRGRASSLVREPRCLAGLGNEEAPANETCHSFYLLLPWDRILLGKSFLSGVSEIDDMVHYEDQTIPSDFTEQNFDITDRSLIKNR